MTEFTPPPPEMIQEAWEGTHGAFYEFEAIATHFARWGWEQRGAANEAALEAAQNKRDKRKALSDLDMLESAVEGMGVLAPD